MEAVKSINITAVLKKAGIRKGEEGRNGRIGYATFSEGFYVEALDKDYIPVYGMRNGKKSTRPTSWKVRNAKDSRFSVSFTGRNVDWKLLDSDYAEKARQDADQSFNKIVEALTNEGFVITEVNASRHYLIVLGKQEN